jgi:hypothetical protein
MRHEVSYRSLNRFLEDLEAKVLNILGYIPIVSTLSGAFRFFLGKLEFLGSLLFALLKVFLGVFTTQTPSKRSHFSEAGYLLSYAIHALFNMFRGCLEMIPFLSLVTCLLYDRLFHLRLSYFPTKRF